MHLVRLTSILLYPVATYLVISPARFGSGISGSVPALRWAGKRPPSAPAARGAAGFSAAVLPAGAAAWFAGGFYSNQHPSS